jgi:hypothetical protein
LILLPEIHAEYAFYLDELSEEGYTFMTFLPGLTSLRIKK